MTSKRGLTLIEIIIAMALVGIIAAAILPLFTGYFKMLTNTKKVTANIYQSQQNTELEINNIRDDIKNGSDPGGAQTFTLFTGTYRRTVNGYVREVTDASNRKICFVVGDTRMAEYEVAVASNVKIGEYASGVAVANAKAITPSLSITATSTITDPHNVNMMNINKWYVSREGFNIPVPANPPEVDIGTKYPKFPDDYYIIGTATGSSLTDTLSDKGGKHIIYTITPASQSGKMGESVPSNPVFLSGLPVISNLSVDLDASLIDKADTSCVRTSGGNDYVMKWNDVSGRNNNATQSTISNQPQLIEDKFGTCEDRGKKYDVFARYLKFGGGQSLTIPDNSYIDSNNLTVFVVARTAGSASSKSIISKGTPSNPSWSLDWDPSRMLGYTLRSTSAQNRPFANTGEGLDNKWHVLMASGDASHMASLRFSVDNGTVYYAGRTIASNTNVNSNPVTIGWDSTRGYSTIDVAEIVIYSSIADGDVTKVRDYLTNKYKTVP